MFSSRKSASIGLFEINRGELITHERLDSRFSPHRCMMLSSRTEVQPQPGHRDAPFARRHRDEDTVEESAQRVGSLLSTAHCSAGKGRQIPQEGTAGPEPCRVGGTGSVGLA